METLLARPLLLALLLGITNTVSAATFQFRSLDAAGEGLNDPTPVVPTGGNPATTRGQARMNLLVEAGRIWSELLNSNVPIIVDAKFDPQTCSATTGTLGAAAPTLAFSYTSTPTVLYVSALADALSSQNLSEQSPSTTGFADIAATFNSSVDSDPACLSGAGFYYGYDHNRGIKIDLLVVMLHELAHGLGFAAGNSTSNWSSVGSDGTERFLSYVHQLFDEQANQLWPLLTGNERQQSAVRTGSLAWNGANVRAHRGRLNAGVTTAGRVRMFAPAILAPGSSVSHFDSALTPNVLMEPNISNGLTSSVDLTVCAFKDIGWSVTRCPDVAVNSAPVVAPQSFVVFEDIAATIPVAASDADGDSVTFLIGSNPGRGTVDSTLTYIPSANANGTDSFTVIANDGLVNSSAATITIQIMPVNDEPSVAPLSASVQAGQQVNITAGGSDVDGDALTYSVVTNPVSGTVTVAGATLSYRPNNGFSGTDSFTYRASDGAANSSAAMVTVIVTPASSSGGGGGSFSYWLLLMLGALTNQSRSAMKSLLRLMRFERVLPN